MGGADREELDRVVPCHGATFQPSFTALLGHLDTEGTTISTLATRIGTSRQAVSHRDPVVVGASPPARDRLSRGVSLPFWSRARSWHRSSSLMAVESESDREALARACADAMWAEDSASRALGIELEEVGVGRARARMSVTAPMINGQDMCHGGYVFTLADTAFAFACNTYGTATVAMACDIVFVAPARLGDELVAEARERTRFGRNGIYDVTVRGPDGSVVAEFRGRSRETGRTILGGATT